MSTARQFVGAARGSDNRIYAVGGDSGTGNTVEAYDPKTNTWSAVAPFNVPRAEFAVTAGLDGRIYVLGGIDNNGHSKAAEVYDPATNSWKRLPDMPTARHGLAAAGGKDGKIYALGGIANGGDTSAVEVYDPSSDLWSSITLMGTTHSLFAAATSPDGRILAIGGITGNNNSAFVEAYTPKTGKWNPVAPLNNGRFEFAATTGADGQIYAIGGNGLPDIPNAEPFVEVYDPVNDTWTVLKPTLAANVTDDGAATGSDGRIFVIGGNATGTVTGSKAVFAYDASSAWVTAPSILPDTENSVTPRSFLAAATATNGKSYIVGGNDSNQALSDIQAFDPVKGSWTAVSNMTTLREDLGVAAGPDGLIYAIGGMNGTFTQLDSVEAYDPVLDRWFGKAPMNTARTRLATLTGADGRIYAIGGSATDSQFNTVIFNTAEVYDTGTGKWSKITATMITARHTHAAALAPNGLIYVFGGLGNNAPLASVEAYDSKSNTWSSKAAMPRPRFSLIAVTGADGLIYVSGGAPTGSERTVDIYDPAADKWLAPEEMISERLGAAGALGSDNKIYAIGGDAFAVAPFPIVESRKTTAVIAEADLSISETALPSPATVGNNLTYTVSVSNGGPNNASGVVLQDTLPANAAFVSASPSQGTCSQATGVVTCNLGGLASSGSAVTNIVVRATAAGVLTNNASVSATTADPNLSNNNTSLATTVLKAGTSTALSSSLTTSTFGQSVKFAATVKPATSGTPTGTVTFKDGASVLGTSTLSAGAATFTTSTLTPGTHAITAAYGGSTNYNGSTSSVLTQTVKKAATSTAIVSSKNPSVSGQSVTFSATVTAVAPGAGTPTGTVTFKDGASVLSTRTLSAGKATFTTSTLAPGTHAITAAYSGSTNYNGSTSSVLTQMVKKAATSTAVVSSKNPSVSGQSVTFTATVTAVAPGTGTPTGSVTFKDGASVLGTGALSGGKAAFATSTLSKGTHVVTAVYGGSTGYLNSTSPALTQTVH